MGFASAARDVTSPAPALAEIEHLVELAGFGLGQVSVTGHRHTSDSDIFEALELPGAPTLLSFDSRAARDRVERLPWVEKASVDRVIPDRLEVHVTERTPYAVWRLDRRYFLVDKTGRLLATVPKDAMPTLPRVAGEGAAAEAGPLLAMLAERPALSERIEIAERIGGRRWTLHLVGGGRILLPAHGEAEALDRALAIAAAREGSASEIDLRVVTRPLLRAPGGDAGGF